MYFLRIYKIVTVSLIYAVLVGQTSPDAANVVVSEKVSESIRRLEAPDSKWYSSIERVNFNDVSIRDILQSIAVQNNLNVIVDNSVKEKIGLNLNNVTVWELITYLSDEYNLSLEWKGNILVVKKKAAEGEETKKEPDNRKFSLSFHDSLLSIYAKDYPLREAMEKLSEELNINILVDQELEKRVSGRLTGLPPGVCLRNFLEHNGLGMMKKDGIIYVFESFPLVEGKKAYRYKQWINVSDDDKISLNIVDCPVDYVIDEIAKRTGIPMIKYSKTDKSVTAKIDNLPIGKTLEILLRNTPLTYKYENGTYFIGDRRLKGMVTNELIKLKHIKSDGVIELLPQPIKENAEIKEVKELNGIMIIATKDVIEDAREFMRQIDHITPQILLEAVVVDYTISDIEEFRLKFGLDKAKETSSVDLFPFLAGTITKKDLEKRALPSTGPFGFISKNIGVLPIDFYVQLKAMEEEGYAKILSKPHIATLNGHKASISIATTQYYIFESEVIIPTTSQPTTQKTQRFEKITAEIKLEITPWISADGDVTVDIHPEFSTPIGQFNPEIPPTINSRILKSTVRLKDGETIVLGGLIQDSQNESKSKFPFLGDVPILGALFRGWGINNRNSELVVYITPHINQEPVSLDSLIEGGYRRK